MANRRATPGSHAPSKAPNEEHRAIVVGLAKTTIRSSAISTAASFGGVVPADNLKG